ncbi:MAG TPA: tetratricopeptide repeat protein [Terriglobales bacterium]|nr:tetratricopeptide repeat protein [Terriglobales bacterium]
MSVSRRFFWIAPVLFILLLPVSVLAVTKEAQKHYDEAMNLKTSELSKAIIEMKEAIRLEPKWAQAHYDLGTFYQHKKLFDDALREYRTVGRLDPNYPKLHYVLGSLYYTQGVIAWSKAAQIDQSYFYKDDGKQVFYKPGTSPEKALAPYKKIVEKDTTNALAFYNLRGVYYDLAILEYQQAVKAYPNDTAAQYELGLVYLERAKIEKARLQIKTLEKLSEGHANGLKQQIDMEVTQRNTLKEKK